MIAAKPPKWRRVLFMQYFWYHSGQPFRSRKRPCRPQTLEEDDQVEEKPQAAEGIFMMKITIT
jgi:hypothetical protein